MHRQQGYLISLLTKIEGGGYTDRQQGDLISFFLLFQNKEKKLRGFGPLANYAKMDHIDTYWGCGLNGSGAEEGLCEYVNKARVPWRWNISRAAKQLLNNILVPRC
jgi:hypothetical protein